MPKSHAGYAPEYRRRMVELVRAGRNPDDLAKEFGRPPSRFVTGWRRRSTMRAIIGMG